VYYIQRKESLCIDVLIGQPEVFCNLCRAAPSWTKGNILTTSFNAPFVDHLYLRRPADSCDETVMCQLCRRRRKPVIKTMSSSKRGRAVSCLCKQPVQVQLLSFFPHPCRVLVCVLGLSCPSGNAFGRASPCVAGASFPGP
jgi:hypothetical protein